jgi:hypothetical protein
MFEQHTDKTEVAKERVSLFCVVTSDGRITVCKDEEHAKLVRANWCAKLPVIRIDGVVVP